MKRGRAAKGDQLTGGSGDVSPQWFVFNNLSMSAANTFTETNVAIPVQRLFIRDKRSMVMELLKVQFNFSEWDTNPAAGGQTANIIAQVATTAIGVINVASPQVMAHASRNWRGAFTAAGSYEAASDNPVTIDTTDGAGHGILIATDNIFYGVSSVNYVGPGNVSIRLLYRWKEVTLEEYIGIVQSQQ